MSTKTATKTKTQTQTTNAQANASRYFRQAPATKQAVETLALATHIRETCATRAIETFEHATVVTGSGIPLYRFLALLTALRLEVRCPGMRMTRGPKCSTRVRQEFGLKGNPAKLLVQLDALYLKAWQAAEEEPESA